MKKVLITGGAGFIGFHLAQRLVGQGYHVDIVDNFSRGKMDDALTELTARDEVGFHDVDLLSTTWADNLADDYTTIFHFAAIIGVKNVLERPYDVLTNNVKMHEALLGFAKKQAQLERFIFPSTSEVYAGTLSQFEMEIPTPEATPLAGSALTQHRTS